MRSGVDFLPYSEGLITRCESALANKWHRGQLALTRKPKSASKVSDFLCVIEAGHKDFLVERKLNSPELPVLPVRPMLPPTTIYFGIRLRFDHEFETTYGLTSASLSFFSGIDLQPIARAEWDRRDIGKSRHAQPHWHLHGLDAESFNRSQGITGMQPATDFVPVGPQRVGLERIHFPTSAAWQTGVDTRVQHPFVQNSHLIDWIEGMGDYMEEQFRYLLAKSGGAVSQGQLQSLPAIDFSPTGLS